MNHTITILDGHTLNPGDLSWENLQQFGSVNVYAQSSRAEVILRAKEADVLIVNKVLIDAEVLAQLPKLKCICVSATGYNNIDINAAKARGIVVCNVRDYCSPSVAQRVFAYLLHFTDQVVAHHQAVQEGAWGKVDAFCFWNQSLIELSGKTLGIIGLGKIGTQVAKIADAFGLQVLGVRKNKTKRTPSNIELTNLDDLCSRADFITIHAPLTLENKGFVNASFLDKMKNSAYLINTSRGALVNERDLKNALESGQIAGAALDVISEEPPQQGNILFGVKNCLITPHNAWGSIASRQRMMYKIEENILAFINGEPVNVIA